MRLQVITVPYRYDEHNDGLGAGPGALLQAGLAARLGAAGHEVLGPQESILDPHEREPGRTAVNIGRLGAKTGSLVATARRDGVAVLVLAGDDTAGVGVISGLQQSDGVGTPIGLVWLDAHGDFNTPETSVSGILAGMPVAILAGLAGPNWRGAAGLAAPVPTDRIVIAGVRDLDKKEELLLRSTSVRLVGVDEVRAGEGFTSAVDRLGQNCTVLSLHVDLDVLDPELVPSSSTPAANGLDIDEAAEAIATVLRTGKVATVVVSSLNPGGGARGRRSVETTLAVLERALRGWERTPALPAS
ncbi:MAG: arginase [Thermomicrobiales bacterium]|nr:arginase [Thermomicrobiales bacterium]